MATNLLEDPQDYPGRGGLCFGLLDWLVECANCQAWVVNLCGTAAAAQQA